MIRATKNVVSYPKVQTFDDTGNNVPFEYKTKCGMNLYVCDNIY